jgi:hypothetical protein
MKIETAGTYIGTIEQSTLEVTKNNFPQWVAFVKATKKYIETAEEMKHFQLTEPGYVDASTWDQQAAIYMVLFNNRDGTGLCTKENMLLNAEWLQAATGWTGESFDSLCNDDFIGKSILFRVEETKKQVKNAEGVYVDTDETVFKTVYIGAETENPTRTLKPLATDALKALNAKLKIGKPAASAKPASPAKPGAAPSPKVTPASGADSPASNPTVTAPPAASNPPTPKSTRKPAPEKSGLPEECTQSEAWKEVCDRKGPTENDALETAWIKACAEMKIGDAEAEKTATPRDWAKVRDLVLAKLNLMPTPA